MRKILESHGTATGCQSVRHDSHNRQWGTSDDAVRGGHGGSSGRKVVHLLEQAYFFHYRLSRVSEVYLWLGDYVGDQPGKNRGSFAVNTRLQMPVSFWGWKLGIRWSGADTPVQVIAGGEGRGRKARHRCY